MSNTTLKPSGLTITRDGMKFIFTWKITDKDYKSGQQLQYKTNLTHGWRNITVGNATTKKTLTLSSNDYYPATAKKLTKVIFRVRGKRKPYTERVNDADVSYTPDWSSWSEKTFNTSIPALPRGETELLDSNVTKFSWNIDNDSSSNRIFKDFQYQSIRLKESTVTDGSKLKWSSTNAGWKTGTSTYITITEDSALLADASYVRWVRVRSRGAAGASAWRYLKHVYAKPYKAVISDAKRTVQLGATTVQVRWAATSNAAHPIDQTTVEYLIDTPAAGLIPAPSASWTDAATSVDTKAADAAKFVIGSVVGLDQCLWVRIKTQHDSNISYSAYQRVSVGSLTTPSDLSVETNSQTYRATVTATNNSSVPGSRLAIVFRQKGKKNRVVGLIESGSQSATVQCPTWTSTSDISFAVYAFYGTSSYTTKSGVRIYSINATMKSAAIGDGGDVPSAPGNFAVTASETPGEVILSWDWTWTEADSAEISWSQNPNAWESTEQPDTFLINNLNTGSWRISNLDMGVEWFFRVRFAVSSNDSLTYGPYTDTVSFDLTSAPNVPVLELSNAIISENDTVTASWGYVSTDTTGQSYAEICQAEVNGETITYGTIIAHADSAQHVVIDASDAGWTAGNTYYLCVKVTSASGHDSEWSDPVPIQIAEGLTCLIAYTSLVEEEFIVDYHPEVEAEIIAGDLSDLNINADSLSTMFGNVPGTYVFIIQDGIWKYAEGGNVVGFALAGEATIQAIVIDPLDYGMASSATFGAFVVELTTDPETRTELVLDAMPMVVTANGAGAGGTTTVIIERAEEYHMLRPDGDQKDGYDGETIAIVRQTGDAQITISDLVGVLDDGAHYRLIASVEDGLGRTAQADPIVFMVKWAHQAEIPSATETINGFVSFITPTAPAGYVSGDTCDIYRLSADKPELIVEGGSFGTTYVDPYPAIGEGRGHRIVHKTLNGDYITAEGRPAWIDTEADLVEYSIIIDFDGNQLVLPYDINLTNQWKKDFKSTAYLGGAQQGDWNPIISRTATYTTVLIADEDSDMARMVRTLGAYSGICHVRTPEGSSFAANINVSENKAYSEWDKISYTLSVTRVDPEGLDGMTYEEWINELE